MDDNANADYEAVCRQIAECAGPHIEILRKYIRVLPPFPEHITSIYLRYCPNLKTFPTVFSSNLKEIKIWGTAITELPEGLPDSVERITIMESIVEKLPSRLPTNLKFLILDVMNIPRLPELPGGLRKLYYVLPHSSCRASSVLPDLPDSLEILNICHTPITKLPERLPSKLKELFISHTHIGFLPKLPDCLQTLSATFTRIDELPDELPKDLRNLTIGYDNIKQLPKRFPEKIQRLNLQQSLIRDFPENIPDSLLKIDVSICPYLFNQQPFYGINYLPRLKINRCLSKEIPVSSWIIGSRKRCIERCKAVKEELMAATWHTDRVLDWCDSKAFDYED